MARSTVTASGALKSIGDAGRSAPARQGTVLLVRCGYAAKGIVYLIIGLLAARLAIGGSTATPDRKSALLALYHEPFGKTLLGVVAVGLATYALWSLARALFDPEHEGREAKAVVTRIGYVAVGVSYGLLSFSALQLVMGSGSGGKTSDASTRDWTARLLGEPFGQALVMLVGLVVLGVAAMLFRRAYTASFRKRLDLSSVSPMAQAWLIRFGRFGLACLGVVFSEIGLFLILAAWRHNAHQALGLGGALDELTRQAYGHLLLTIVAVGLMAYGLFSLTQARYRRITTT